MEQCAPQLGREQRAPAHAAELPVQRLEPRARLHSSHSLAVPPQPHCQSVLPRHPQPSPAPMQQHATAMLSHTLVLCGASCIDAHAMHWQASEALLPAYPALHGLAPTLPGEGKLTRNAAARFSCRSAEYGACCSASVYSQSASVKRCTGRRALVTASQQASDTASQLARASRDNQRACACLVPESGATSCMEVRRCCIITLASLPVRKVSRVNC